MVNENIKIANTILESTPFEYQNEIIKLATGMKEDIYTPQPVAMADYGNLEVRKNRYGNYSYKKDKTIASTSPLSFKYDGVENASLYGYITNGSGDNASVSCGGIMIDSNIDVKDYSITFPMGTPEIGVQSEILINPQTDKESGSITVMTYALDHALWEEAYSRLVDESFNITEFSDTLIKGNVNVIDDGVMYFSIPYEKGWSVYVDGKKTKTFKVMDAMLGVNLKSGQHDIELKYIPDGFIVGASASAGGVFLFIVFAIIDFYFNKRRRRKNEAEQGAENNSADTSENTMQTVEVAEISDSENKSENNEVIEAAEEIEGKEETEEILNDETSEIQQTKDADNEKS